jgi:hypothetical protein
MRCHMQLDVTLICLFSHAVVHNAPHASNQDERRCSDAVRVSEMWGGKFRRLLGPVVRTTSQPLVHYGTTAVVDTVQPACTPINPWCAQHTHEMACVHGQQTRGEKYVADVHTRGISRAGMVKPCPYYCCSRILVFLKY